MSKTAAGPETTTLADPYRFSTEQFDKMVDAGAFGEDDVELLGGAIYPIMTENEPHQLTVERVAGMLRRTLPADQWHVREEKHVEIADDWKPRPDVHVLRGSFEDYWRGNRRPGRHAVVLLVEVCETTRQHDEVFQGSRVRAGQVTALLARRSQGQTDSRVLETARQAIHKRRRFCGRRYAPHHDRRARLAQRPGRRPAAAAEERMTAERQISNVPNRRASRVAQSTYVSSSARLPNPGPKLWSPVQTPDHSAARVCVVVRATLPFPA